ncbi:MAG: SHOCT domain-containing protein [Ferruginibacter sp.]|nr:SHOCT domain-containing protein [Ferruginibacter sp.]
MKKFLVILLFFPLFSIAQKCTGRFENDTLYTSNGFKMYKGQNLQMGVGKGPKGTFRFVNIKGDITSFYVANTIVKIRKLKNFGISSLGNGYITIIGSIIYKDGSKGGVNLHVAFDKAIESVVGDSEIIVPAEFRKQKVENASLEIERLYKLYQNGVLTKEEFEAQKKKVLSD